MWRLCRDLNFQAWLMVEGLGDCSWMVEEDSSRRWEVADMKGTMGGD